MLKKISIKDGVSNDYKEINKLTRELGYDSPLHETKTWLDYITKSSDHKFFVGRVGKLISGWIVVERRITLESGFRAEITGLIVRNDYRKTGLGKQLVDAAVLWALNKGLSRIVVSSNILRDDSHSFYKKVGFELMKTSHFYEKKTVIEKYSF